MRRLTVAQCACPRLCATVWHARETLFCCRAQLAGDDHDSLLPWNMWSEHVCGSEVMTTADSETIIS